MTYEEWERVAAVLHGLYPSAPSSAQSVLVWFQELAHLDADIVEDAIRRHARRSKWPPALAEVLELAVPEQEVRQCYDALPNFTGSMELTEAEWLERLEAGLAASRGVLRSAADRDRIERIEGEIRSGPALPEGNS